MFLLDMISNVVFCDMELEVMSSGLSRSCPELKNDRV